MCTTVLYADHPGPSCAALVTLLSDIAGTELVDELHDPALLVEAVERERPDVVVIDDRLLRGAVWTADKLGARLIVVGVDDDPGFLARARRLGAEAWVPKDRADSLLPQLIGAPVPVAG